MTQPITYYAQNDAIEPQEGMRYFDLSKHPLSVAEMLYQELAPFVSTPFLMPDGRLLSAAKAND